MFKIIKKIFYLLIILGIIGGLVYYYKPSFIFKNKGENIIDDTLRKTTTIEVDKKDLIQGIDLYGEVSLVQEQDLTFGLDKGKIIGVYVDEGAKVKKGDLLAVMDKGDLNVEIQKINTELKKIKNNLKDKIEDLGGYQKQEELDKIKDLEREVKRNEKELVKIKRDSGKDFTDEEKKQVDAKNAQEDLKKNIFDYKNDIETYKNDIKDLEFDLESLKKELVNYRDKIGVKIQHTEKKETNDKSSKLQEIKEKQTEIDDKKDQLDKDIEDYNETFKTKYDTFDDTITNYTQFIDGLKDVFGKDGKNKKTYMYFSGMEPKYKNYANEYYNTTEEKIDSFKNKFKLVTRDNITEQNILDFYDTKLDIDRKIFMIKDNLKKGAMNSISSEDFTEADISALGSYGSINVDEQETKKEIREFKDLMKNKNPEELKRKNNDDIAKINIEIDKLNEEMDSNIIDGSIKLDYNGQKDIPKEVYDELKAKEDTIKAKESEIKGKEEQIRTTKDNIKKAEDEIKENQKIIDGEELTNKKDKAGDDLDQQKDKIDQSKRTLEKARKDFLKNYGNIDSNNEVSNLKEELKAKEEELNNKIKDGEKYEIKALFKGNIDKVGFKVGDNLTEKKTDQFIRLINKDLFEITVLFDQIDIVNIKKGMKADISFDSMPGSSFIGTVKNIDSKPAKENDGGFNNYGAGDSGGGKKYPVKIEFGITDLKGPDLGEKEKLKDISGGEKKDDLKGENEKAGAPKEEIKDLSSLSKLDNLKGKNEKAGETKEEIKIFPGMNARVQIIFNTIKNALVVPTNAIQTDDQGNNYVNLTGKKPGEKIKKIIEVGEEKDGQTQILGGLKKGDKIIEFNFDNNDFKAEEYGQMGGMGG